MIHGPAQGYLTGEKNTGEVNWDMSDYTWNTCVLFYLVSS